MSLKIIGGTFKNHLLKSPLGPLAKPTTSLMRKAVFDICQNKIEDASFLDLFACSGAMGIEALSRGAKRATFIEKDRRSAKILQENLNKLNLEKQALVLIGDVFSLVPKLKESYDIIYIDPPYPLIKEPKSPLPNFLQFLDQSSLLASETTVFLEEGAPPTFPFKDQTLNHLQHKSTRKFGESILHELISKK